MSLTTEDYRGLLSRMTLDAFLHELDGYGPDHIAIPEAARRIRSLLRAAAQPVSGFDRAKAVQFCPCGAILDGNYVCPVCD